MITIIICFSIFIFFMMNDFSSSENDYIEYKKREEKQNFIDKFMGFLLD